LRWRFDWSLKTAGRDLAVLLLNGADHHGRAAALQPGAV
jgi:hypothetical protein